MTAFGTPELVQDALHSGAYQVLDKPFEIEALANLVAEATAAPAGVVSPAAAN
jgi:DNA-binding NtrC family response regulator